MISQQYRPARAAAPVAAAAAKRSLPERMADTMRDMRAAGQIVTAESLAIYGDYTNAEIAAHASEAANLARAREVRQVA